MAVCTFMKYAGVKIIAMLDSDALPFGRLWQLKSQATPGTKAVYVML